MQASVEPSLGLVDDTVNFAALGKGSTSRLKCPNVQYCVVFNLDVLDDKLGFSLAHVALIVWLSASLRMQDGPVENYNRLAGLQPCRRSVDSQNSITTRSELHISKMTVMSKQVSNSVITYAIRVVVVLPDCFLELGSIIDLFLALFSLCGRFGCLGLFFRLLGISLLHGCCSFGFFFLTALLFLFLLFLLLLRLLS